MNSLIISIVRTFVPYLVGLLAVAGVQLTDADVAGLTSTLGFVFSLGYYVVVRLVEKKYPQAGWLLGAPTKPTYKEVK